MRAVQPDWAGAEKVGTGVMVGTGQKEAPYYARADANGRAHLAKGTCATPQSSGSLQLGERYVSHCARLHDIRILRSTIERRGRAIIEVRSIHSCRCSDAHKLPCGIDTGSKHSDYECTSLGKPNNPYLYLLFLDRKP